MVLDVIYKKKLPEYSPHSEAMDAWKTVASEGRTGGALWSSYETLYWTIEADIDLADLVLLNDAQARLRTPYVIAIHLHCMPCLLHSQSFIYLSIVSQSCPDSPCRLYSKKCHSA